MTKGKYISGYYLSETQERFWALYKINPKSPFFNISFSYRISGEFYIEYFKEALEEVIKRHEILRTNIGEVNGSPVQIIQEDVKPDFIFFDNSKGKRTKEQNIINREVKYCFDLEKDNLIRFRLIKQKNSQFTLVITMHHIISDAWSINILMKEIFEFYNSQIKKKKIILPEIKFQYKDYAAWEREKKQTKDMKFHEAFWQDKLQGDLPILDLPIDRIRPAELRYNGFTEKFVFDREMREKINKFAAQHKTTVFNFLFTALNIFFYKITGQTDIIIGTFSANRDIPESENVIGAFMNNLPIRSDLSGNPELNVFLKMTEKNIVESFSHQHYSFDKLLGKLSVKREMSHSPIFNLAFQYDKTENHFPLAKAKIEEISTLANATSKFDMKWRFWDWSDRFMLDCEYNTDLFDNETIKFILSCFNNLLQDIFMDDKKRISEFKILSEKDNKKIKFSSNTIKPHNKFIKFSESDAAQSIVDRFEKQVRKNPTKIALTCNEKKINYYDLDKWSGALSDAIGNVSGKGANIALMLGHNEKMVVSILGTLKSGCLYIPLEPSHPSNWLKYVLADSEPKAIITDNDNFKKVENIIKKIGKRICIINLDKIDRNFIKAKKKINPNSPAYILYTSGSTGKPKGVLQTHSYVMRIAQIFTNSLHISANDSLTLIPSFSFSAAMMDMFGALLNGASLHLFDIKNNDFLGLAKMIKKEKITIFHSIPEVFRYFVGDMENKSSLNSIRIIYLAGGKFDSFGFELFKKTLPPKCLLVNALGCTEFNICRQQFLSMKSEIKPGLVPIGHGLDNIEMDIIGKHGESLGYNQPGEIIVKSKYLSFSFWHDKEMTAKKLTTNKKGEKIFHTGDLGKFNFNGSVTHLGRKDFQIKVRGYRIEPAEIEIVLLKYPNIKDAIVMANKSGENIIAYYVAAKDISETNLRSYLNNKLPGYMIPNIFFRLKSMPLTPNGKIDRMFLTKIKLKQKFITQNGVNKKTTKQEEKLIGIWKKVLERKQIAPDDNFFSLGGNSLKAIRVASFVGKFFDKDISVLEIFQYPTVRLLAKRIKDFKHASY